MNSNIRWILHYLVEFVSVVAIAGITIAYLITGYYEKEIIIGAFVGIGTIAAIDIFKRSKLTGGE